MPRHLNGFALAGLVVVAVALIVNQASAFFLPASTTTIPSTRSRPAALGQGAQRTVRTRGLASAQLQEGMHGTGSRFLSITQLRGDELMPRIIPIAGVYPGITAQEFMAPASTPSASYGRWAYDFSDPEGPQVGTVAYPASALVHACADPVVLIASNDALGIDLAGDHDMEAMVLVDRGDRFFQATKFYAFAAPDGSVVIRWFDQIPEGWALLGKVHYITLPWTKKTGRYKSGWMEVEDDD